VQEAIRIENLREAEAVQEVLMEVQEEVQAEVQTEVLKAVRQEIQAKEIPEEEKQKKLREKNL